MSRIPREYQRGDIVRARFDPIEGSEQGGTRPALVISPSKINRSGSVVILAALTSRKTDNVYPFEAFVPAGEGNLDRDSKVMLRQVRGMDKARIMGFVGALSPKAMTEVDVALRIAVGLDKI